MTDLLFFDTNLLVYSLDPKMPEKRIRASDLTRAAIERASLVVSPQILNECYRVLTVKRNLLPTQEARVFVNEFVPFCQAPLDASTTQLAFLVQDELGSSWWDSVMVASAIQAGCRFLLTEDLQPGREIDGLRIVNPFETTLPLLQH